MTQELERLSEWLKRQNSIPKRRNRKKTLLDIMGISNLENNWSDIYAYFFNTRENHGLGSLFIDTLNTMITERTQLPMLNMSEFSITREYQVEEDKTGNLKRIDLLLKNDEEAIIIENKVHASLTNPLDLYWRKISVPDNNKRGVVMSLNPLDVYDKRFICITHEEFAKAIEANLPQYFHQANSKALILLQDFILNIFNETHSMNEEELKFYFSDDNREKINRLTAIKSSVVDYVQKAVENSNIIKPLLQENGVQLDIMSKSNHEYTYYRFKEFGDKIMLTLKYDSIWNYSTFSRIRMFLELQGDMIKFAEENQAKIKEEGIEKIQDKNNKTWWHYEEFDIPFDLESLSNEHTIAEKIVNAIANESDLYKHGLKIIELYKASKS